MLPLPGMEAELQVVGVQGREQESARAEVWEEGVAQEREPVWVAEKQGQVPPLGQDLAEVTQVPTALKGQGLEPVLELASVREREQE